MGQVTKYKGLPVTNWKRQRWSDKPITTPDKRHKKLLKLIGQCIKSGGHVIYRLYIHTAMPSNISGKAFKVVPYQAVDCELHWR